MMNPPNPDRPAVPELDSPHMPPVTPPRLVSWVLPFDRRAYGTHLGQAGRDTLSPATLLPARSTAWRGSLTFTKQAQMAIGTTYNLGKEEHLPWAAAKKPGGGKGGLWCVPGSQVGQHDDVLNSLQSRHTCPRVVDNHVSG